MGQGCLVCTDQEDEDDLMKKTEEGVASEIGEPREDSVQKKSEKNVSRGRK